MKSKILIGFLLGVSFILGFGVALAYFSDYDLLSKYIKREVQLTEDMRVSNNAGQSLVLPKGAILFYEKAYNEVDHLLIRIIAENIEGTSSLVDNKDENSLYFSDQVKRARALQPSKRGRE